MSLINNFISWLRKPRAKSNNIVYSPFLSWSDADKKCNATYVAGVKCYQNTIGKIRPKAIYKDREYGSELDYILGCRPNKIQNAVNFWKQVTKSYFDNNIAVIYLQWDYTKKRRLVAMYCVDILSADFKMVEDGGNVYLQCVVNGDVIKDSIDNFVLLTYSPSVENPYSCSDSALSDILNVTSANYKQLYDYLQNANNIQFIAKATSSLSEKDLKNRQAEFDKRMSENKGGVFYIDNAQDIQQVTKASSWASPEDVKERTNQIYEYLQVSSVVVNGTATDDQIQSWLEKSVEVIIQEIEDELNEKLFTPNERAFGNKIVIDTESLYNASLSHRTSACNVLIASGKYYPNEIRSLLGVELLSDKDNVIVNRLDRVASEPDKEPDKEPEADKVSDTDKGSDQEDTNGGKNDA